MKKLSFHDDVIKRKHFPRYWPFVRGIHRQPVNSPHKGKWRGKLMFSLICAWMNGWANNREAGDLRRYHAHSDVTVMISVRASIVSLHELYYFLSLKIHSTLATHKRNTFKVFLMDLFYVNMWNMSHLQYKKENCMNNAQKLKWQITVSKWISISFNSCLTTNMSLRSLVHGNVMFDGILLKIALFWIVIWILITVCGSNKLYQPYHFFPKQYV